MLAPDDTARSGWACCPCSYSTRALLIAFSKFCLLTHHHAGAVLAFDHAHRLLLLLPGMLRVLKVSIRVYQPQ